MNELTFKKIYMKLGDRPLMEEFKNVVLTDRDVKMTLKKSFTPAAMANRQGLIGILLNKLFSSMMKREDFEFSFINVKKVTISTNIVLGQTSHNIMFWNGDPKFATYENIDFTLTPTSKRIDEVKALLAPMFRRVEFEELAPKTHTF